MEAHYFGVHWNRRVLVGKYVVFPCGLLHASSMRISCVAVQSLHYHCPVCISSTFLAPEGLLTHVKDRHGPSALLSVGVPVSSVGGICALLTVENDNTVDKTKIRFGMVETRMFPLAASIVEQEGGRSEPKRVLANFQNFVSLKVFPIVTVSVSGCVWVDRMQLFRGLCFLVCGIDVPSSTISAIYSLGGVVTGAGYPESIEWSRITHILLGGRIGAKSVRAVSQNCDLFWVGSEWIRNCVEKGTLFYSEQPMYTRSTIDTFFNQRDAAARIERRKTTNHARCSPIATAAHPRTSPPILATSESCSFMGTPTESPVFKPAMPGLPPIYNTSATLLDMCAHVNASAHPPHVTTQHGHTTHPSHVPTQNVYPTHPPHTHPPLAHHPTHPPHAPTHSILTQQPPRHPAHAATAEPLRRSKRISMSPNRLGHVFHPEIKKL